MRHIKFTSPTNSFSKRLFFGLLNERLKMQVFSFDDGMYNWPFLSNPFRSKKEILDWQKRTRLYDDIHQNESDRSHDLIFGAIISMLNDRIDLDCSIFDVGCNSGYYLQSFYEKGFKNLNGLDPQSSAIEHIKKVRPYVNAKAGTFGPLVNDVQADLLMFINSYDRVPYTARLFDAIDRCAKKYVVISTREFGESYKRDVHLEMGMKGFICLEKRTVQWSKYDKTPNENKDYDYRTLLSIFLFRRLED